MVCDRGYWSFEMLHAHGIRGPHPKFRIKSKALRTLHRKHPGGAFQPHRLRLVVAPSSSWAPRYSAGIIPGDGKPEMQANFKNGLAVVARNIEDLLPKQAAALSETVTRIAACRQGLRPNRPYERRSRKLAARKGLEGRHRHRGRTTGQQGEKPRGTDGPLANHGERGAVAVDLGITHLAPPPGSCPPGGPGAASCCLLMTW